MNMNGGTSTSATDPLNQHRNSAYLGMGLPGPMGAPHLPPMAGNGYGGGLGLSGAAVGPELKHHADFLSRLLAATPSYMNEVGNPPPGFFSDWLRRLVSKPAGGNGSTGMRRESSPTNLSTSSSTKSVQHQTSSMTFSSSIGQAESNGGPPLETTTPTGKRRKRTRISDHLPHHSVKESNSVNEQSSPSPSNILHGSSALATSSASPTNSSSTTSASLNMNPFSHPLWFFPPFLPNPYLSPLSMGMGIPGLLPPPGVPPPPASGSPYSMSSLPNPEHLLSSFRAGNDNLIHGHSFNNSGELNHVSPPIPKKELNEPAKSSPKRNSNKTSKKSTGFSISRLTSPSPSSNSSAGSGVGHKHASNNNNYSHHSSLATDSKPVSAIENSKKVHSTKGKEKRISDSSSETGSGTGVDLRVPGRGYAERSSVTAPPPQSIYKPLSAFRDPADVNLAHSSTRVRDSFGLRESPNCTVSSKKTTSIANKEAQKMILRDQSNLSTTYVLKNLQNIYQRIKEESVRASDSFPMINTALQNNSLHSSITNRTSSHSHAHSFNYSEIQNLSNAEANNQKEEIEDSEHNRDNELVERSPSPEIITNNGPVRIKIPLPRPVKKECNFTEDNSPGFKRSYDQISPNSSSPLPSPRAESEEQGEQVCSPKVPKYDKPENYSNSATTGELDSESDDLNVLSDDPEEGDESAADKVSKEKD